MARNLIERKALQVCAGELGFVLRDIVIHVQHGRDLLEAQLVDQLRGRVDRVRRPLLVVRDAADGVVRGRNRTLHGVRVAAVARAQSQRLRNVVTGGVRRVVVHAGGQHAGDDHRLAHGNLGAHATLHG